MHLVLLSALFFLAIHTSVTGAEAAFSEHAQSVYVIDGSSLNIIELATGEIRGIDSEGLGEIDGLCRAGDGAFYLITENALWRWTPGANPATLVIKADPNCSFIDVACSDDCQQVVITASIEEGDSSASLLIYRSLPESEFVKVRARHLGSAKLEALEFLPDGTLAFAADGDVWHGELGVEPTETENGKNAKPIGSITAYRYAPVAERFAYAGSPSEEGVSRIAFGAGHLFLHVSRIGGSGWGHLSTMAAPPLRDGEAFPVRNKIEDSLRALKSVKELFENGSRSFLCASADRKQVYMTSGTGPDRTHYLATESEEDGQPIAFRIGDKILKR